MISIIAAGLAVQALKGNDKPNLALVGFTCSVGSVQRDDLFYFSAGGGAAASQMRIERVPIPGRAFSWPKEDILVLNSLRFVAGKQTDSEAVGTWKVSGVEGVRGGIVEFTIHFPKRLADGAQTPPTAEFSAVIEDRDITAPCRFMPPAPASLVSQ